MLGAMAGLVFLKKNLHKSDLGDSYLEMEAAVLKKALGQRAKHSVKERAL